MLVVDPEHQLSTFVAPNGLSNQFNDAKRDGVPAHALPWGNAKRVASALTGALNGRRQRFFAWTLGKHQFDGYVLPLFEDSEVTGAIIVGADCAELFELRDALHHSQKITASAYFVLDMATMVVNVTAAFARIWGFAPGTTRIAFDDIFKRLHTDDRTEFEQLSTNVGSEAELVLEYRIIHPAGGMRHLRTSGSFLREKNGAVARIVGTVVDVTEYVLAQDAAAFLSKHDALTGLNNRSVFIEQLQSQTQGSDGKATVVLIDIDHFSQINDTAGHAVGDRLLCAVAERLKFLDQLGHSVARLGGDEFGCLLLEPADALRSNRIIDSLRQRLDVPFSIDDNQYFIRTTMGVAQYPEDGGGGDMLLQNAGIALLSAKGTARGSIAHYHPNLERRLIAHNRIERDLSHAIDRAQFEMYYQPVISADSGEVIAAEALLRWNHPELGVLSPDAFLNVAEESDAVVTIGRWAIERACRDAMTMTETLGKPLRLNVNISPRHVQSGSLVRDVAWALDQTGWKAHNLQLEVTEQLLLEDTPIASSTLEALRASGITIAIDDFGTGYNTLSYLKVYPVSCIKIDRAFVKDSESDDYSRAICRSVTTLAEALCMNLIGEGVETSGQAAFLKTIGCRELQGYHFGRPVKMGDFIAAHA